ncbi:hypothetical protein DF3PB_3020009 [uncultured Defluviicoccus sp.]|uniref:Uncharacterized protein n=1 Tax=metagenome TaxID=256318 RepID=A0A380TEA1_9ZZZZ|nr:hypothetical protein DF3PB_3020009 [uncultured Defluviicoccus sp.]
MMSARTGSTAAAVVTGGIQVSMKPLRTNLAPTVFVISIRAVATRIAASTASTVVG